MCYFIENVKHSNEFLTHIANLYATKYNKMKRGGIMKVYDDGREYEFEFCEDTKTGNQKCGDQSIIWVSTGFQFFINS